MNNRLITQPSLCNHKELHHTPKTYLCLNCGRTRVRKKNKDYFVNKYGIVYLNISKEMRKKFKEDKNER